MLAYLDNLNEPTKKRWTRILVGVNVATWSLAALICHGNWVSGNFNGVSPTPPSNYQSPTTPAPVGTTEPEGPSIIINEEQVPRWIDSDPAPSPQLTHSPSPDTMTPTPPPSPSNAPSPIVTSTSAPEPTSTGSPTSSPSE